MTYKRSLKKSLNLKTLFKTLRLLRKHYLRSHQWMLKILPNIILLFLNQRTPQINNKFNPQIPILSQSKKNKQTNYKSLRTLNQNRNLKRQTQKSKRLERQRNNYKLLLKLQRRMQTMLKLNLRLHKANRRRFLPMSIRKPKDLDSQVSIQIKLSIFQKTQLKKFQSR